MKIGILLVCLYPFILLSQNSEDTLRSQKVFVFIGQESSEMINFLSKIDSLNFNAIGLNIGLEKEYLIDHFYKKGSIKYINGEDFLGYKNQYYEDFLNPLKRLFFESTLKIVGINPLEDKVGGKFEILRKLIRYDDDFQGQIFIDSLRTFNFGYSDEYVLEKGSWVFDKLKEDSLVQHVFGPNSPFVKILLKEIEISFLKMKGKDFSTELNKYYEMRFQEFSGEDIIIVNPSFYCLQFLKNQNTVIFINETSFRKKGLKKQLIEIEEFGYTKDQVKLSVW